MASGPAAEKRFHCECEEGKRGEEGFFNHSVQRNERWASGGQKCWQSFGNRKDRAPSHRIMDLRDIEDALEFERWRLLRYPFVTKILLHTESGGHTSEISRVPTRALHSAIDILQVLHLLSHRTSIGECIEFGTDEFTAGHARPNDPEGACVGRDAWPRDFPPNRANHKGYVSGKARVALSGAAPEARIGLAHFVVGRVGKQSPRKVLQIDEGGPQTTRRRNRALEPHFGCDRACAGSVLTERMPCDCSRA